MLRCVCVRVCPTRCSMAGCYWYSRLPWVQVVSSRSSKRTMCRSTSTLTPVAVAFLQLQILECFSTYLDVFLCQQACSSLFRCASRLEPPPSRARTHTPSRAPLNRRVRGTMTSVYIFSRACGTWHRCSGCASTYQGFQTTRHETPCCEPSMM